MRFRIGFVLCLVLILTAFAQVPRLINYQGRLTDSAGDPIPDGDYYITFHLYNAPAGGSPIWSESFPAVTVENGLYAVLLGSTVPFPAAIDFSQQYWLEVEVDTTTLSPRYALASSPYAIRAIYADSIPGSASMLAGEGIINYIPLWEDTHNLGTSSIYNTPGHIGMQKDVNISYKLMVDTILSAPSDTLYLPEIVLVNELVADSIEALAGVVKIRDDVHTTGNMTVDGNVIVHDQIISEAPAGTPPLSAMSSNRCPNLNADMVDGNHAGDFAKKNFFYIPIGGGATTFEIPHYNVCTITIGEAHMDPKDIAFIHLIENDGFIAWVGSKSEDGTMTNVSGTAALSSTDVIFTLSDGNIELKCPGDGSNSLQLTSISQDVRGMVIY